MMTPDQIDALHAMNDFMSRVLLLLRQDQARVTQLLAVAKREHDFPDTDQHHFENMLALAQVDHHTQVYKTEETDDESAYPTGRVDVCITTGPLQSTAGDESWAGEYINVEFQFDNGRFIAMVTKLGPKTE